VLLVDDHALFRNGIARLLKNEPGFEVVGEAKDGQEAIEFAQKHMPNVILMDISMPGVRPCLILGHNLVHLNYLKLCRRYFSSFTETWTALVIVSNSGE